jgi:hypothetical protein
MKKLLLVSLFIINFHLNSFDCFSQDPELNDSAYWASIAIDLFAKKEYEESIKTVDACFNFFSKEAVIMQNKFTSQNKRLPPSGRVSKKEKDRIHENWAVNDVSVALWAKARSLDEIGKKNLAKKAYAQCIFLTYGRAWDPNGWFWVPASDCAKRGRKLLDT